MPAGGPWGRHLGTLGGGLRGAALPSTSMPPPSLFLFPFLRHASCSLRPFRHDLEATRPLSLSLLTPPGPGGQGERPVGQPRRGAGGPAHAVHGAHELPWHAGALAGRLQQGGCNASLSIGWMFGFGFWAGWRPGAGCWPGMRHVPALPTAGTHARAPAVRPALPALQASIVGKARAKEKAIARITVLRQKCGPPLLLLLLQCFGLRRAAPLPAGLQPLPRRAARIACCPAGLLGWLPPRHPCRCGLALLQERCVAAPGGWPPGAAGNRRRKGQVEGQQRRPRCCRAPRPAGRACRRVPHLFHLPLPPLRVPFFAL